MVYNGKPYFLMDDLGGKPTIFGNIQLFFVAYWLPGIEPPDLWIHSFFARKKKGTHLARGKPHSIWKR